MCKFMKRAAALFLSGLLLLCLPMTALAEETGTTLRIGSAKQLLHLAENCRLDSNSQDLTVTLISDIDLSGVDFPGIPIFCGEFDGNGHTISGVSITPEGSTMGLFRYVSSTATIHDLTVEGTVAPEGSRNNVGGIAGRNEGTIRNCTFSGTVSGGDNVGGIAGVNAVNGVLEGCRTEGSLSGKHHVGGMAGSNQGVIRTCSNRADINTTVQENEVELSDITLDTITGNESANTVTDIGGLAGTSSGVIRDSSNWGSVGYPHMGYNIGGIAGTQSGYLYNCANFGSVSGRKEVGGIVGQMLPTTILEYTEDTLQILQRQLRTLSSLSDQAVSQARGSTSDMLSQVGGLQEHIQDAANSLDPLLQNLSGFEKPDEDTVNAAVSGLNSAFADMNSSLYGMADSMGDSMSSLGSTLRSISGQIAAMSGTIGNASEHIGGTISDISDEDNDTLVSGKVAACRNSGDILADRNAGGIVGAVSVENQMDPEEDLQIVGDSSLNFNTQLRAVITGCKNTGTVSASHQKAGGIVGWMALGLAKDCLSTGTLDAEDADYVGGIAGQSSGYIRSCNVKSTISGSACVGGIAGSGVTVTDCRSMVKLTGAETTGAVLGQREESSGFWKDEDSQQDDPTENITENYYLPTDRDIGAIDGVSYAGCAQPLSEAAFGELRDLDPVFHTVSVRFVYETGLVHTINLAPGEALSPDSIPSLPAKAGYVARWDGLEDADLSDMDFDITFQAVYTPEKQTVQSDSVRDNGLPIVLAQGQFSEDVPVRLTELKKGPAPGVNEWFLEGQSFTLPAGKCSALRYLPESSWDARTNHLYVQSAGGSWREVTCTQDVSYLVFPIQEGDQAFCITQTQSNFSPAILAGAGAAIAVFILVSVLLVRRSRKKKVDK